MENSWKLKWGQKTIKLFLEFKSVANLFRVQNWLLDICLPWKFIPPKVQKLSIRKIIQMLFWFGECVQLLISTNKMQNLF
jgi:hypothetical protein